MTRRVFTLTVLGLGTTAAALAAAPDWTRAAGLDVWSLPDLHQRLDDEAARRGQIEDARGELSRRNRVKQAVMAGLAAGQLDLRGAAAEFLALAETRPMTLRAMRAQFPDGPDERRAARSVLVWAKGPRGVPADVLARLEAEFRTLYPG